MTFATTEPVGLAAGSSLSPAELTALARHEARRAAPSQPASETADGTASCTRSLAANPWAAQDTYSPWATTDTRTIGAEGGPDPSVRTSNGTAPPRGAGTSAGELRKQVLASRRDEEERSALDKQAAAEDEGLYGEEAPAADDDYEHAYTSSTVAVGPGRTPPPSSPPAVPAVEQHEEQQARGGASGASAELANYRQRREQERARLLAEAAELHARAAALEAPDAELGHATLASVRGGVRSPQPEAQRWPASPAAPAAPLDPTPAAPTPAAPTPAAPTPAALSTTSLETGAPSGSPETWALPIAAAAGSEGQASHTEPKAASARSQQPRRLPKRYDHKPRVAGSCFAAGFEPPIAHSHPSRFDKVEALRKVREYAARMPRTRMSMANAWRARMAHACMPPVAWARWPPALAR
jgi:hypothetical protein